MSERTGLGPLELAVLEAAQPRTAGSARYRRSSTVLSAVAQQGFGPSYAYPVLVDLAVPWKRHLCLLDGQGNYGSPGDDPPADAEYTEVRLSPLGRLALAAER